MYDSPGFLGWVYSLLVLLLNIALELPPRQFGDLPVTSPGSTVVKTASALGTGTAMVFIALQAVGLRMAIACGIFVACMQATWGGRAVGAGFDPRAIAGRMSIPDRRRAGQEAGEGARRRIRPQIGPQIDPRTTPDQPRASTHTASASMLPFHKHIGNDRHPSAAIGEDNLPL